MRVAIHQPNLVPWRPFFAKMAAVDVFVVLTQCQFNREHYQHRFKLHDKWYTMSVDHVRHRDLIANRTYADPHKDWDFIKRRLPQYAGWFSQFDDCIDRSLVKTNFAIILRIAEQLGLNPSRIVYDPIPSCTGTDRLVEICRAVGATTYLAGRSGASYMELEKFAAAGITVEHQLVTDTRHVFET